MKAFKTSSYGIRIEEKEILEFGEKSVFYLSHNGKRQSQLISTHYESWHKTKQEAIDYITNRVKNEIERLEYNLTQKKQLLEKVNQLYKN